MDRLFLDANVLFTAAHNPDGKAASLFAELRLKRWQLMSSAFAIAEARRNIAGKFPQCAARLDSLLAILVEVPQPATGNADVALPDKDLPIYRAAQACGATHLLTGDMRHFGPHMNRPRGTGGMIIQTVAEYLAAL
ncbi:MAG: PIN domain-containing protein [Gammaproteobacteria bacterium]